MKVMGVIFEDINALLTVCTSQLDQSELYIKGF